MAFKLYSDVRETSATGGTGDQVLAGAFDPSYFRFGDRYANSDTFFYCMKQGTAREVGLGTRVTSGDKISRTKVYKSTNSDNLVNFANGQTIDIFVTFVAPDDLDATGKALLAMALGFVGQSVIINGDFRINQRTYVSGTATAAGVYMHDRWKAGNGGATYTFTQLASSTPITITAGTIVSVVEDKNVKGSTYVLSWSGTAQARAGVNSATPSGSYVSSPLVITGQTQGTVMSIEFNAGSLDVVKLETGTVPTPFVMSALSDELARAYRYCRPGYPGGVGFAATGLGVLFNIQHLGMYAAPSVSPLAPVNVYNGSGNITQSSASVGIVGNTRDAGMYAFPNIAVTPGNLYQHTTVNNGPACLLTAEL